jgi:hypothetical protein
VAFADALQLVELGRVAEHVDGHDCLCARGDGRLDGGRVNVERRRIDIGKDRAGSLEDEAIGRSDERERGRDRLVTRSETCDARQQMEAGRSARHRGCVRGVDASGDQLLEAVDRRPEGESAGAQHLQHELFFAAVEVDARERDRVGRGGRGLLGHASARAVATWSSQSA